MTLASVLLVPGFMTNVVALPRLQDAGMEWHSGKGILRNGTLFINHRRCGEHWVVATDSQAINIDAEHLAQRVTHSSASAGPQNQQQC